MGNRLKGRVEWPYTKRCKGPAIIGVLRAQLKLGKGKRISRRAIISTGLKQDLGQNIAYTGGRGAWTICRYFPRKAYTYIGTNPLLGYTINITRPFTGIKIRRFAVWAMAQPLQLRDLLVGLRMVTHSSSVLVHSLPNKLTLLRRILSIRIVHRYTAQP